MAKKSKSSTSAKSSASGGESDKSRLALAVLQSLFGMLGGGRLYLGCYKSGFLLMAIATIGLALLAYGSMEMTSNAFKGGKINIKELEGVSFYTISAGLVLTSIAMIWFTIDYVIVAINIFASHRTLPFGAKGAWSSAEMKSKSAMIAMVVLLVLQIVGVAATSKVKKVEVGVISRGIFE